MKKHYYFYIFIFIMLCNIDIETFFGGIFIIILTTTLTVYFKK
jgi:hypothetical protein